jgi:tripartite-type tricarboxylate transporter receptor subunit TctC
MVNSSFAINPAVFSKMPFDPKKDFVPIVNMAWIPSVLVVPANSPYKNLAELLNAAKPEKNEVSYGSCGNGTPQHLAGASLNIYAKTHITHIPYGGCGPALKDVLGGQIPLAIITASSAMAQIKAGKLRALAVTTDYRSPVFPEVPTMAEMGYPAVNIESWQGMLAPKGTPTAILEKINKDVVAIVRDPANIKQIEALGFSVSTNSVPAFNTMLQGVRQKYADIITRAGIVQQ